MLNFNALEEREKIITYLRNKFDSLNPNSRAIIGISGGKDSTICAALLVRALGKERVLGVIMPDKEMPDINDAEKVCECLGIDYKIISIYAMTKAFMETNEKAGITIKEGAKINTPPRVRMTELYLVNACQPVPSMVVNTCNRSEDYIGYSTKFGDQAGDVSVLQDLLVSEVLAIGDTMEELPKELVHKTPSDGLCGKTDEDNLGFTYRQLDNYINWIDYVESFKAIPKEALTIADEKAWDNKFAEYKAIQKEAGLGDDINVFNLIDFQNKVERKHLANLHKLKKMPSYMRPDGEEI